MNPTQTEQLWDAFRDPLWRFVRARVASDPDADDVVQDVFLKVHTRSDQLRDDERVAGWVFRIASNAVYDLLRTKKRTPAQPEVSETPEPLAIDEAALLAQCVRPFVEELPEIYRDALIMTEFEGRTQAEAAELAGVSVSGMKSRVQRARALLRSDIEDCCDVELDARNSVRSVTPR